MLNSGLGFSDEFEMEACQYSEKSSSKLKQQYKEWTSSMRKEGTAFFKSVKEKVRVFGLKLDNKQKIDLQYNNIMFCTICSNRSFLQANPAMKSAVKTVKNINTSSTLNTP